MPTKKKFTRGDRVIIVGGKYPGAFGYYLDETTLKYLVKLDGLSGERYLDKKNVSPAPIANEKNVHDNKETTIAILKEKCDRLQQELEEMRAILEKMELK
jgi:hypothetical protein